MKALIFLALLPLAYAGASPLEDVVNGYDDIHGFNDLTYKSLPVEASSPGDLCVFLGYQIALNQSVYTVNHYQKGYQLTRHEDSWSLLEIRPDSVSEAFIMSVVCARKTPPAPMPAPFKMGMK